MTIGAGIFLTVVGAILRYAVADQVDGVDLQLIGLILMIAGIVGTIIGILMELNSRRVVHRDRVVVDHTPRY
jgi:hypothetical protein